ncbi:uncharacterized protein LOC142589886 isoform X2 [Dermacentor variabilis]|uniref:uncharacterized protein LOC142589886 isoform X2 n=1 Tax=Dermacentor variabilis TaxID=34621 RepID=UPI003F5B715C
MGDVFCLVILQSGNRRKLKLTTGTHVELLEKLAGIVEFDSENTLIQIFDADLDDFVDLLPEDPIPNKAKLRAFSRSASTMCGVPVTTCGYNAPPACPPPQASCASETASVHGEGDVSLQACDAVEIQETADYTMETSEPVLFIEIPRLSVTSSDAAVQTIAVAESDTPGVPGGTAVKLPQVQDEPSPVQCNRLVSTIDVSTDSTASSPVAKCNRDDCLKFVLPPSFGISCDTFLENKRPVTAKVRRHIVSVLFKACCKMTLYPTNRLYNRVLDSLVTKYPHVVEGKYDRRRWLIALKSRFKTARPKLPESSVAVDEVKKRCGLKRTLADADGEHAYADGQHMPASQKSPLSSSTDLHMSHDKPSQQESGGPDDASSQAFGAENSHTFETTPSDSVESSSASELAVSLAESNQLEEELFDCPDYHDAILEDVTVSELLGMCTDEAASETLMAEEGGQASPDKQENCDKPAEEPEEVKYNTRAQVSPDKRKSSDKPAEEVSRQEEPPEEQVEVPDCEPDSGPDCEPDSGPDCEEFKLPSFGIFDDLLRIQVPVNTLMQRHIISKLFDTLCKITVYPSTYQYDAAVDSLLEKYPHLSGIKGKKGKKFWRTALKAKFYTFRNTVAGSVWNTRQAQSKYAEELRQQRDNEDAQHTSRPLYIDLRLSEDEDKACQQGKSEASTVAENMDYHKQALLAKARHVAVREMTVEKAISTFPVYRKESSLLGEFKILWRADIADCFEKGIKKLFLILMNCGTNEEIKAMSKPGNDILMVVLKAIARRCGERLGSLLIEETSMPQGNALPTPCLVTHVDKSVDVFVNGVHLFTASSLLGGLCALFASFWVFHIEYSRHAKGILTFLEHAFLYFNYTTPHNKCRRFINLYKRSSS